MQKKVGGNTAHRFLQGKLEKLDSYMKKSKEELDKKKMQFRKD